LQISYLRVAISLSALNNRCKLASW